MRKEAKVISAGAQLLFEHAKAHVDEILEMIDQYNQIADDISALGFVSDIEPGWPVVKLELVGNGCKMIDESDFLEEFWRGGPKKKASQPQLSAKRLKMLVDRERIGKKFEWACAYCQGQSDESAGPDGRTWHIDHVYPVILGGDDSEDNLVLACATCNLKKQAMLLADWFQVMETTRRIKTEACVGS